MINDDTIKVAIRELICPSLEITSGYQQIIQAVLSKEGPIVARVNMELSDTESAVWFYIPGSEFYLIVNVNNVNLMPSFTRTESGNKVLFQINSDTISFDSIVKDCPLKGLFGWSVGDVFGKGLKRRSSIAVYQPNEKTYYEFEEIIKMYLIELITYKDYFINNSHQLKYTLRAFHCQFVNGNMGIRIDSWLLNQLNAIQAELDIDTRISGYDYEIE